MRTAEQQSLFVYGSLREASIRDELLGRAVRTVSARLPGYERHHRRYFYVVRRAGAQTTGLVLKGLSTPDFEILDRYEEVPSLYTRRQVEVVDAKGRRLRCWTYLPTLRLIAGRC
jgi:gamma-glutamylcyclotransferase (GGCT)/AIG2-like uncharacterized protein YtfP